MSTVINGLIKWREQKKEQAEIGGGERKGQLMGQRKQ